PYARARRAAFRAHRGAAWAPTAVATRARFRNAGAAHARAAGLARTGPHDVRADRECHWIGDARECRDARRSGSPRARRHATEVRLSRGARDAVGAEGIGS